MTNPASKRSWADTNGTGDRKGSVLGLSGDAGAALAQAGTFAIILLSPLSTMLMYIVNEYHDGDIASFWGSLTAVGPTYLLHVWPVPWGARAMEAWAWVSVFGLFQAALQLLVPGRIFHGPISPMGNVPIYKANGIACFALTGICFYFAAACASLFLLCILFKGGKLFLTFFRPARLYDIFGEVLAICNVFAWVLCLCLAAKGLIFPSTSDSGSTGSLVYDFYWGTELYPRIGRSFDIKTWTNCRMGMMSWTFIVICFACKQVDLYDRVSNGMVIAVVLTGLYNVKFFLWETGYWKTMDIAHDRAGYYLCWGCLNWVPGIYTSQVLFMTRHPYDYSQPLGVTLLVVGAAMIFINWEADSQRQQFRESEGKCLIWSRKPCFIRAKYQTGDGDEKTSLLLASGWWGVARHFHYVPEILGAICWTAPAQFGHIVPWTYVLFLALLLLDRLFRDDRRCRAKYGRYWEQYCNLVPYRLIPFVW